MTIDAAMSSDILAANQSLREWAAGLRAWSRSARQTSEAHRHRTHTLKESHAKRGGRSTRPPARVRPPVQQQVVEATSGLPELGTVRVSELFLSLVDGHGFGAEEAVRALATGLLVAGYPADCDAIATADAFDVVENAVCYRP